MSNNGLQNKIRNKTKISNVRLKQGSFKNLLLFIPFLFTGWSQKLKLFTKNI